MAPKAKTGDAGGPSSRTKTKTEDAGGMSSTAKPATEETYTLEPGETSVEDLLASPTFAGFAEHFHKEDLHDRPRLLRQLEAAQAAVPTKFGEDEPRRRSSAYSFVEANRDFREVIVDPGPKVEPGEISWKAWLPIAFAVIPPIAGLIFKNGSAFFSDLTLLGLASIFLHWSIVAPWKWYCAARWVRDEHEVELDPDSGFVIDVEPPPKPGEKPFTALEKFERIHQMDLAKARLRMLEVLALMSCYLAPPAAGYLLYLIREFLKRPAEGLVSNFNIGIFLLAAEIRPLSHGIKLILAHTLHLQYIVTNNPFEAVQLTPTRYTAMLDRIEALEKRLLAQPPANNLATPQRVAAAVRACDCGSNNNNSSQKQRRAAAQLRDEVAHDVRAALQPEIDAVVRAVRRYEKKTSTLTHDTDLRLADLGEKLDDAVALSALAARNSARSRWSYLGNVASGGFYVFTFPLTATVYVIALLLAPLLAPVRWVLGSGVGVAAEGRKTTTALGSRSTAA